MSPTSGSGPEGFTRRTFLKATGGSVVLLVTPVHLHTSRATVRPTPLGEPSAAPQAAGGWSGSPGEARYRIEGLAKVTGRKIYARDFRAKDFGWPGTERAAVVLRARYTDREYLGLELPPELPPRINTVNAALLDTCNVCDLYPDSNPPGQEGGMFVAESTVPQYLGQPLAILIFQDAAALRSATRILQFNPDIVRYGPPRSLRRVYPPYDPPTYLTRYRADGYDFSQVKNGTSDPYASDPGRVDLMARHFRERIDQDIAEHVDDRSWSSLTTTAATQTLDPMFMEPETGLGWREGDTMHLVLGTQSTNGDVADVGQLFEKSGTCGIDVSTVRLYACYPGGGFGGRDESPFSPLLMLAAAFSDGPVRLVRDRFEQFQAGIKQGGVTVDQTLAVDASGRFQALRSKIELRAGGKNNYSQFVAALAGYSAGGGYAFDRVCVDAVARPSTDVIAGSMRGFGGPQAAFALETLIDEVATMRGIDAIDLRIANALRGSDFTITGAPPQGPWRIVEILEKARAHPLWRDREAKRRAGGARRSLAGVGFALANQAFGTGKDGVMASVDLGSEGLTVRTNAVDMGNGSATTLALGTSRHLGRNADRIHMGVVAPFNALGISHHPPPGRNHEKSHTISCEESQPQWGDPTWTEGFSSSSSACLTAYHQEHAVQQASAVLFRTGVWPAAAALWGIDPDAPDAWRQARWSDGALTYTGQRALPFDEIRSKMEEVRLVTGVMAHAFFSGVWVEADFTVDGRTFRWPIDGLAVQHLPGGGYATILRQNTAPPPVEACRYGRSQYAPSASLIGVEVDPGTGRVRVTDVHTILDAGRVLQPDLLSGQYQGGVAMGIGSALIESFPTDGGEGAWNLNRYHVALSRDVPLDRVTLDCLPPEAPDAPAKGIAEAVLCPIAPAIANAVSHAVGSPIRRLPITPSDVRRALR